MKKLFVLAVVLIAFLAGLTAASWYQYEQKPEKTEEEPAAGPKKDHEQTTPKVEEQEKTPEEEIDEKLAEMSLEEKVGQLMMVGFYGTTMSSQAEDLVANKKVGGIIYFDRNMTSPEQTAKLSNELQKTAKGAGQAFPLMIGVDQEGGDILRMRSGVSPIPSQQKLGKIGSTKTVYESARINASELAAMGINVNFAPVLDLSKTDSRSFGSDPKKTADLAAQVLNGFTSEGLTGALKHFPGNGRSSVDPHIDPSSVQADQSDLENSDIYPFTHTIQSMNNQDFFVMVTHINYPAYDADNPASLSSKIMKDLLREKLGFTGLVVTDDLEMGAVTKLDSFRNLGVRALKAGADLLLVCHEYDHQLEVYNGIIDAVKSGRIPEERINEAAKRVLLYKRTKNAPAAVNASNASTIVRSQEHVEYFNSLK